MPRLNIQNQFVLPMISVAVVEDHLDFQAAFVKAINAALDTRLAGLAGLLSDGLKLLLMPAADVLLVDLGLPDGSGKSATVAVATYGIP